MDLDAIWKRGRADLTITTKGGDPDIYLYEYAVRVTQNALRIAELPSVRAEGPDEAALALTGLYHAAGWIVRCRHNEIDRADILLGPLTQSGCELAASMMEASAANLVSAESLERASLSVRSLCEREPSSIEARIVLEARHLEEFGLLMLWPSIRRGMMDGKGVQAVIDTWRRKKEYQFWTARLKDSFRYKPVRELAEQRLKKLESFMQSLEEEHLGRDMSAYFKSDDSTRRPVRPQNA